MNCFQLCLYGQSQAQRFSNAMFYFRHLVGEGNPNNTCLCRNFVSCSICGNPRREAEVRDTQKHCGPCNGFLSLAVSIHFKVFLNNMKNIIKQGVQNEVSNLWKKIQPKT